MEDPHLAILKELVLKVDDQVGDGCWPRPTAALTVVELELRKHRIKITDDTSFLTPTLTLHGLGYAMAEGACAVDLELRVNKAIFSQLPYTHDYAAPGEVSLSTYDYFDVWSRVRILTGNKTTMQSRIKNAFEEMIEALLLDHTKARDVLLEACPMVRDRLEAVTTSGN